MRTAAVLTAACLAVGVVGIPAAWTTARRLRRRYLAVTVVGRSMEPAYTAGDVLLARRRIGTLAVGDVVVLDVVTPDGAAPARIVKRVAAAPGDLVPRQSVPALADVVETVVPQGKLVVLGDNPASTDSRHFGYVDASRVTAVVARRIRGGRR